MEQVTFGRALPEPLPQEEYTRLRAKWLNDTPGKLQEEDGYDCPLCRNRGYSMEVRQGPGGLGLVSVECACMAARKSLRLIRQSGLEAVLDSCTFERFRTPEPWQEDLLKAAKNYAADPRGWFFLGGQSGSGKTHLGTAICRELLHQGRQVVYMLWRDEIVRLKANVMDGEAYGRIMDRLKFAEVLFVDDLFKSGRGREGQPPAPTASDIQTAFELLNFRYCDPRRLTILTSELTMDELMAVDEALGGRVAERADCRNVGRDRAKNWRLK